MKKQPRISIIVPIYNVESYLVRCLESLLAQTEKEIEIICVDDGSKDGSFAILKQYAEKDKRIIALQQENHGVEWARSTAMKYVSSDYIMFCDPDDWYEPDMCKKMVTTLEQENVDIVMCDANIVGEEDKGMEKYFEFMPEQGKYEHPFDYFDKVAMVLWKCIFKKELIDKYKIIFPEDENIRRGYDTYFCIQYFMCAKTIYFLHEKLYNYWQRSDSLVHQFNTRNFRKALSPIYGFAYVLSFMKRNNFYNLYNKKIFQNINNKFSWWLRDIILFKKERKEGLSVIYRMFKPFKKDINPQYDLLYQISHKKPKKVYEKLFQNCSITRIYLFKVFLLLKIKRKTNSITAYLFGFIPLLKIKEKK